VVDRQGYLNRKNDDRPVDFGVAYFQTHPGDEMWLYYYSHHIGHIVEFLQLAETQKPGCALCHRFLSEEECEAAIVRLLGSCFGRG